MTITGIDALVFGVEDLPRCRRFFADWGLREREAGNDRLRFETLDGGEIVAEPASSDALPPAMEDGSTVRRAIWGVATEADLTAVRDKLSSEPSFGEDDGLPSITDPNGLRLSFRVSRRRAVDVAGTPANTCDNPTARQDSRGTVYDRAEPVKIGHLVLFTPDVKAAVAYYTETLGFVVSDYYPDAGYFLRCAATGGHHQLFLLQTPDRKRGLNHVAFTVRDIHEVFGGGLHVSRRGWRTQIGPGRHPISAAYFWYLHSPTGGLFEYYADEDWCTEAWRAKAWERTPEHFAEWAIAGGIDGKTRRQAKDA